MTRRRLVTVGKALPKARLALNRAVERFGHKCMMDMAGHYERGGSPTEPARRPVRGAQWLSYHNKKTMEPHGGHHDGEREGRKTAKGQEPWPKGPPTRHGASHCRLHAEPDREAISMQDKAS